MARRLFAATAAVALLTGGAASAQSSASQTTTARFERTDTADQMRRGRTTNPRDQVCRTITATGSRLGGRRDCRTRQEWDDLARDHRETTEEVIRQNNTGGCIAGPGGAVCG